MLSVPQLPGAALVRRGLRDLADGDETVAALVVSLAPGRLGTLGIDVPEPIPDAHDRLWERLYALHGDGAHSKFNALRRELVSFQRALACAE